MMAIVSPFTLAVADPRYLLLASVERTVDPSVSEAAGLDAVARRCCMMFSRTLVDGLAYVAL